MSTNDNKEVVKGCNDCCFDCEPWYVKIISWIFKLFK